MIYRIWVAPLLCLSVAAGLGAHKAGPGAFDVRDFGAIGDGITLDTQAIQAAIDRCAAEGGGRVVLAGGRVYLSGTVVLKSGVTLWIDAGAVLRGSLDKRDYPDFTPQVPFLYSNRFTRQLIYAEKQTNIGIAGPGTIDGNGLDEVFNARTHPGDRDRPYILRFAECNGVRVRDIRLLNSARWCAHFLACDDVVIDGATVLSSKRENRDGLDIDSCNRVRVANCRVETGDDAIVLKATTHRPCKNVAVCNCHLSSQAAAFKLGTESNGGFENIVLANCTIHNTSGAGISLLMVDGAALDGVSISNVVMDNVATPIFIRLGNRARPLPDEDPPGQGSMRNIMIRAIQARNAGVLGCAISGIPGAYIENLTLRDIRIHAIGGGKLENATAIVPEHQAAYPSPRTFGTLPAYGMFIRHVRHLTLDGIDLSFDAARGDERPALVLDDVCDANLNNLRGAAAARMPAIRMVNCQGLLLSGCRAEQAETPLLSVEGVASRDIAILGNDLCGAQPAVNLDADVPESAVRQR